MAKAKLTSATRRPRPGVEDIKQAANMLKADHDEAAFEKRLKKIAKAKAAPKRAAKKSRTT